MAQAGMAYAHMIILVSSAVSEQELRPGLQESAMTCSVQVCAQD